MMIALATPALLAVPMDQGGLRRRPNLQGSCACVRCRRMRRWGWFGRRWRRFWTWGRRNVRRTFGTRRWKRDRIGSNLRHRDCHGGCGLHGGLRRSSLYDRKRGDR